MYDAFVKDPLQICSTPFEHRYDTWNIIMYIWMAESNSQGDGNRSWTQNYMVLDDCRAKNICSPYILKITEVS